MKNYITFSSILLTSILSNTGCASKVTPITPQIENIPNRPTHNYSLETRVEEETVHEESNRFPNIEYNEIPLENSTIIEEERYHSEIEEELPAPIKISREEEPSTLSSNSGGEGYQLPTVQGESLSVSIERSGLNFPQYQGKVILFEIFGKHCEFCFEEMPIIQKLKRNYGDKLQIITIQGDERMSPSTASRLIAKYHMNYPIIERDDAVNILSYIGTTYSWTGTLPFIQILKDGVTEATFNEGGASYNELSSIIDTL